MGELSAFQAETKETLQTIFPQIPIETEQVGKGDFICTLIIMCTWIIYVCLSPPLVQLATGIHAESSGGSHPSEPGVSVKHSFAGKHYSLNTYWFKFPHPRRKSSECVSVVSGVARETEGGQREPGLLAS